MVASKRTSRRGVSPLRKPNEVDAHVGRRLRLRRVLLGISQEELAARLGLTFQQVQKYELGANRVSASRLYQLASLLEVPVSWFFDEMDRPGKPVGQRQGRRAKGEHAAADMLGQRESLELLRVYYEIEDRRLRKQLYNVARLLAGKKTED